MADDDRKQALEDLARFCTGIIPTNVGLFPTLNAGIALSQDLRLLADRVDKVIRAYGDYADSRIGGVDTDLFKDQLLGALDGNALYEIERCAREAQEAREEDDLRDGHREPQRYFFR